VRSTRGGHLPAAFEKVTPFAHSIDRCVPISREPLDLREEEDALVLSAEVGQRPARLAPEAHALLDPVEHDEEGCTGQVGTGMGGA
jgi:hypothetical protein